MVLGQLALAVSIMGGILLTSACVFSYLEDMSLLDSFYFSTITFTSVGFGDHTPKSSLGRFMVVVFSFLSMGTIVWALEKLGEVNLIIAKTLVRSNAAFLISIILLSIYLVVGTALFTFLEGFDSLHSFYMCTAALTTIGYGDVVPSTSLGKIFMILFVLSGIGITSNALTQIRLKLLSLFVKDKEE